MSKYRPLANFLRRQKAGTVTLTFTEIERIVGRLLPKASNAAGWWQADAGSRQPQKRVFAEAGIVAVPDMRHERVVFSRGPSAPPVGDPKEPPTKP